MTKGPLDRIGPQDASVTAGRALGVLVIVVGLLVLGLMVLD